MTIVFWGLAALVAYAYVGYPLMAALAGRVLNRRVAKDSVTPRVSVVIAAFNEADEIEARLRNVLGSRYPEDRLEVVVASDGSTDDTVAIASRVDPARVQVLDLARRGKAAALADGAGHATGEILVFTDANTMFEPDALAMLARNFADLDVGGVAGRTEYVVAAEAESAGRGEDLYWRYDTWLKSLETRTGSVVSAHGGMYAIRRNLFRPVEDPAVTDDFAISTAVVAQGKRLVFECDAVGRERTMVESGPEFQRRVRLMTRGLTGVVLRRRLLNPFRYGFYAIALASRKVLRRLIPLAFPPLALMTLLLAPSSRFFTALAAGSVAFAALALCGWALRGKWLGKLPLFYVPFFFCLANLASVVALWNVARGLRIERWTPQRHSPARQAHAASGAAMEAGAP
jgi:cellulose synthase/poly-beta-1,6-N-acetylglucosamine synthase-like glycosyltransferase